MRAIGAALTARGVEPQRIATEIFGAVPSYGSGIVKGAARAPHAPDGPPAAARPSASRAATSSSMGRPVPEPAGPRRSLRRPGRVRLSHGVCHNCESGILAGDVTYHTEPLEPPPEAGSSPAARAPLGVDARPLGSTRPES